MQINRTGAVNFGNGSINIWEERVDEKEFKKVVFKRVIQQLNRLNWTLVIPQDYIDQYGLDFARGYRTGVKGDLKCKLDLSGRSIKLKFWQSVNTPNRSDHDGQYEPDIEAVMPYLIRLEMERTRRKIRDYLCNVFSGYEFDELAGDARSQKRGPGALTSTEWIKNAYLQSWHFKGNIDSYQISEGNAKSADGGIISHGQRVWYFDRKGRSCTGIAMYNINNMWWVISGRYDVGNEACFNLYLSPPSMPRVKRNDSLRKKRLNQLMNSAAKSLDFSKAQIFKDLLFPNDEAIYVVRHRDGYYHRTSFCGYSSDISDAGKFTYEQAKHYERDNELIKISEGREQSNA